MCEIANSLVNTPARQQPEERVETILKISEVGNVWVGVFSMEPIGRLMLGAKHSLSH